MRCRHDEQQRGPLEIPANEELLLEGMGGQAIEIEAVIEPGDALEFGLNVLRSPDGAEQYARLLVPLAVWSPRQPRLAADRPGAQLAGDGRASAPRRRPGR